jgi:ATP-dependent DNA ligase
MALPLKPPIHPQLAKTATSLPDGGGWSYEPKLDGFRAIAFVDGDEHHLQSRNGRSLDRYFPEIEFPPGRYVLDGELVVRDEHGHEDFEGLQQRIHPAASRVNMLAGEMPAHYVAFDVLAQDDEPLLDLPQTERRKRLEALVAEPVELIEQTSDLEHASTWLKTREGVIAKRQEANYKPGERVGMVKIRRTRTLDCVVIGWRERESGDGVASLILGLYTPEGEIRHVGHTSGFTRKFSRELVPVVEAVSTGEFAEPGPSRWSRGRDSAWHAVRKELVCEVEIEHVSGGRIRHGARFQRWRDDKPPAECTVDQIDQ